MIDATGTLRKPTKSELHKLNLHGNLLPCGTGAAHTGAWGGKRGEGQGSGRGRGRGRERGRGRYKFGVDI